MHENEKPMSKAEELFNERIVIENGVIVLKIYRISLLPLPVRAADTGYVVVYRHPNDDIPSNR